METNMRFDLNSPEDLVRISDMSSWESPHVSFASTDQWVISTSWDTNGTSLKSL